jgi:coenzyme F420 hydrogenase subunit beta
LCVDGTGEHADVSVGDFWEADASGYPTFQEQEGRSVVIARTQRGADLLEEAVGRGVIVLRPLALEMAAAVQPLQVERRMTLAGRLAARKACGLVTPKYRGYGVVTRLVKAPRWNLRAFVGTILRTRRNRNASG